MLKLGDVVDAVHRRCRFYISDDNAKCIQVKFNDNNERVRVVIILDDNLSPETLTSISAKYERLFSDMGAHYSFSVYCKEAQPPMKDVITIWKREAGFIEVEEE